MSCKELMKTNEWKFNEYAKGAEAYSRQWGHACVLNKRSTNFGDSVFATMKFVTQMIHFTHGLLFLFSMRTMVKIIICWNFQLLRYSKTAFSEC